MASSIYQIFIVNLVLFILVAPIYIFAISINLAFLGYVTAIHVILGVIVSSLSLEIIADSEYSILGLYSIIIGILGSTVFNFIIFQITGSTTSLLVAGLPILWTGTGLSLGVMALFYNFLYTAYGIDFLNQKTNYGTDTRTEIELEEIAENEQASIERQNHKEVTGEEFLRSK